jgi:hypothetical protein
MKKIIIAVFTLGIISVAAIFGGLQYFTQQFVDTQIEQVKKFALISYEKVNTSLDGSTTVKGLTLFIPVVKETIHIESIKFSAPDLMTLLELDNTLKEQKIPETLHLSVSGLTIGFNGHLMNLLDNPDTEPNAVEALSTLACGNVYRIGSKALSEMGYTELKIDIDLNYRFDSRKKSIHYIMSNKIKDMAHINISGDLLSVTDLSSFANIKASENAAKAGQISLEIIDDSYISRKNHFCAKKGKRSVDEYIEDNKRQVNEYLATYGIKLETGLYDAYNTILKTSASMVFEADLSTLSGTEELSTFAPNDIIQFVHLQFFVADKRINEISIEIDKEKLLATITAVKSNDEVAPPTPDKIVKKKVVIIRKYHRLNTSALVNYNGYRVKIETTKGKKYKGRIKTTNPKKFEVITRFRSGNVSYFLPPESIEKVDVYY